MTNQTKIQLEFHPFWTCLNRQEWIATFQLLAMTGISLILLPDRNLGPWNALNPHSIGVLVVLIAGTSYGGYFARRFLGDRVGLLATAILGALVSSTVVTVSLGRMARRIQGNFALLGAGISAAAGIMALRILTEVSIVNPLLLPMLLLPILVLALVPLVAAGAIALHQSTTPNGSEPGSPSELEPQHLIDFTSALGYGAVLSVLFMIIRAGEVQFGNAGIYILAALSGITDVDAVSLSLAQASHETLPLSVATTGILIASMVNTLVKAILATLLGGWQLARWCASILLIALGVSLVIAWCSSGNINFFT